MTDGIICVRCRKEVGSISPRVEYDPDKGKSVQYAGTIRRYTFSMGDLVCEDCLGEWIPNARRR